MTNKRYIIIPGCCDLNRGDQALGWETRRIMQEAGFQGDYSILAEHGEPIEQSKNEGYEVLIPILEHPSRKFKNKDNIVYSKLTKFKWGSVAVKDFIYSILILKSSHFRKHILCKGRDLDYIKTLKRFSEADAIFMKGGGLIQSHGGWISSYATYYRLYHIFLAEALNKPVYILPNSYGPFDGPLVKWMVKKAFQGCILVTAREKKSQDAIKKELGMDIECFPDLAFFLKNGNMTRERLCIAMNIPINRKIVAITMRPYRFPCSVDPQKAYENFKNEMRIFIQWLSNRSFMPLIIEHTFAITSHENDGDCIKDVIEGLDKDTYRLLSDPRIDCRELKSVYGCCDYIIGTRFHSLVFALSNMVPGIAISYDGYKSVGIMRDMQLEDYVIDITEVTAKWLEDKFNALVNEQDNIRKIIKEYMDKAEKKRNCLIEQLKAGDKHVIYS